MKLLVVALPVPDSRATVKVAAGQPTLETKGLKFVCNPFDEYAIEQAVQLKETRAAVDEIVALAIGGPNALISLRAALAMGADRAIHINTEDFPTHDEIAVARVLAEAVRLQQTTFDLILCGKQTIDNDSGELGPALAEFLDLPHAGAIVQFNLDDSTSTFTAHRRIEGAEEILQGTLPALITCEKGLVEPRFPSLPNLMKAKKKPMITLTSTELPILAEIAPGLTMTELTPPPPRPECTIIEGEPAEIARELTNLLRTEAKVI